MFLIQPAVEAAITSIRSIRTTELHEVNSTIQNDLQDYNIIVTETNKQQFREKVQHKFVDAVIDQLQERLPNCEELSAFTIFDPQKVPHQSEEGNPEAFQQWGTDQLAILERMYAEGMNPDICKEAIYSEWESLKQLFSSTYHNLTMQGMLKLLVSNATLKSMYPQLSKMASTSLVIPLSTAECDRCFSAMKRIKTDL